MRPHFVPAPKESKGGGGVEGYHRVGIDPINFMLGEGTNDATLCYSDEIETVEQANKADQAADHPVVLEATLFAGSCERFDGCLGVRSAIQGLVLGHGK